MNQKCWIKSENCIYGVVNMEIINVKEKSKVMLTDSKTIFKNSKFDIIQLAEKRDFFKVALKPNGLELTMGPYVGSVPINDKLSLNISPKISIDNFFFLLKKANMDIQFIDEYYRSYLSGISNMNMLDLITLKFIKGLKKIEQNGIYRDYVEIKKNGIDLKGKIVFKEHISKNIFKNIQHKVVYSYDDYSRDIVENQVLKYVIHYLIRYYKSVENKKEFIKDLKYYEDLFYNVSLNRRIVFLNKTSRKEIISKMPSLRRYYNEALIAAFMIIDKAEFKFEEGNELNTLPSIYVNTADLFEKYCRIGLAERAQVSEKFYKNSLKLFSDGNYNQKVEPDIVYESNSTIKCIIDAKYKSEKPSREDIFQMISYLERYKCCIGVFVLPKEDNLVFEKIGLVNDKQIYIYRINISNEIEDCEKSLNEFYSFLTTL